MQLPEGNDLEVQIQAEGELETRQSGALEPAVYSATIIEVDPGAKYQHVIPLYYNGSNPTGYVFHKAGPYRVRASLRFSSRTRSDVATAELPPTFIKVTAPTGAAAEAYAQLATPAIAKAFQLGTTSDAALVTKLRSVGERYPQTSYGREALRTAILSEAYSEKADLRQILPKLQKYQDLYPQELMTDQVVYTIVAAHNTLQQTDLAREWFFYLLNAYPQSTFIRKHDQIYIYYYKAPANATKGQPWYLMERPWEVPGAKLPVAFQQVAESQ